MIKFKEGVEFAVIAPGGFRILQELKRIARSLTTDITITSGTDGEHSGPDDPHKRGEAYDIRSHDLPDKNKFLMQLSSGLGEQFYAFLEDPNGLNEHVHVQVAKGHSYTIMDLLQL